VTACMVAMGMSQKQAGYIVWCNNKLLHCGENVAICIRSIGTAVDDGCAFLSSDNIYGCVYVFKRDLDSV
jgi:hypothetical protein